MVRILKMQMGRVAMKKTTIITSLVLIVLIGVASGVVVFRGGPSQKFTEIKQLQARLLDDSSGMTEAERRSGWTQVKQMWETFSDSEQRKLKMQHQNRERQKLVRFMQLKTEQERNAFLDAELAVWSTKLRGSGGRSGDPVGNVKSAEQRKGAAKKAGGTSILSAEAIRAKERHYLDSTSPEIRAYHDALKKRWLETHRPASGN
jgi:hypothetical protein